MRITYVSSGCLGSFGNIGVVILDQNQIDSGIFSFERCLDAVKRSDRWQMRYDTSELAAIAA